MVRQSRDVARAALRDLRCFWYTEADVRDIYAHGYHEARGYAKDDAEQARIKQAHAEVIVRNARAQKVLEAGCSNGELVRALRARGTEAWGFDISASVYDIAYPDARPYVRQGSILDIPFGAADGFDTLVAIDVFEHIPRRLVPKLVSELVRMRVRTLVTLINHISVNDPGHVSLFPMFWWERKLAPHFRLRPASSTDHAGIGPVYGIDPSDPVHVIRFWDATDARGR